MRYSPVVVFTYNRYDEVMQAMTALSQNIDAANTDVYVFSNAAIPKKEGDFEKVHKIRTDLHQFSKCFRNFSVVYRDVNNGSNENMTDGIDRIVNEYGRVIVLEDDIVTAPAFLPFMNQALDEYEDDKEIFSICGYNPVNASCKLHGDSFAYDVFRSWGWAIWKDRWNSFSWKEDLATKIDTRKVHSECPLYITALREDIIYPKNMYDRFLDLKLFYKQSVDQKIVIYSQKSLCDNIGMAGNGLTLLEDKSYRNDNFDPEYDAVDFALSKAKLTIDSDREYFYQFRKKTFVTDIFFELHFNRERLYMNLYYALLQLQMNGEKIDSFFLDNEINKIAIYGWSIAGKLLFELLEGSGVEVAYIIDRRNLSNEVEIPSYHEVQNDIEVEAIVVTALRDFLVIEEKLYGSTKAKIISMDDLVYECLRKHNMAKCL